MTILTVIDILQEMNRSIVQIRTAPDIHEYPRSLNNVDLPAIFTYPGPAQWRNQTMDGLERQDRNYIMRLFVAPISAGLHSENMIPTVEIIQALGTMFMNDPNLGGTVDHIGSGGIFANDTGLKVMEYAGESYFGCEFTIPVTTKGDLDA